MRALRRPDSGCGRRVSRQGDDLILRATGPEGDEVEVSGGTTEDAWRAMAQELAAQGEGRLIRQW